MCASSQMFDAIVRLDPHQKRWGYISQHQHLTLWQCLDFVGFDQPARSFPTLGRDIPSAASAAGPSGNGGLANAPRIELGLALTYPRQDQMSRGVGADGFCARLP